MAQPAGVTDSQKRRRFRDILTAPDGILAPDPLMAVMVQECGFQLAHLAGNAMHKSLGPVGVRSMLLALRESGTGRDYFAALPGFHDVSRWYRGLGS